MANDVQIKIGSQVRQKGHTHYSDPWMTVVSIGDDGSVGVEWFADNGERQTTSYPMDQLELRPPFAAV